MKETFTSNFYKQEGLLKTMFLVLYKLVYRPITLSYILWLRFFCKINKHVIVFESLPDYSDNSRALSDYLLSNENTRKYHIFWCVNNATLFKQKYPKDSVTFIEKKNQWDEYKLSSLKIILTAKMLLGTHGIVWNYQEKHKGQMFIRLWHGCSYKDRASNDGTRTKEFDFALVSGPLFVKIKSHFWNVDERFIHPLGFPRYDWLLKKNLLAKSLYENYRGDSVKVVMWMPTFRNDIKGRYNSYDGISYFPLMKDIESWYKLDKLCKSIRVTIVIKSHPLQKTYSIPYENFHNIKSITNEKLDDCGITLYEFLAVTDGLITDYSSAAFDYLLVDKPIAFALDDFERYKDKRGFVFVDPLKYMPGHHLYTLNDLYNFLCDLKCGKDIHKKEREDVRKEAIYESSCYCKEIVDALGL